MNEQDLLSDGNIEMLTPTDTDAALPMSKTARKSMRAVRCSIGRTHYAVQRLLNATKDVGLTRNIVKEILKESAAGCKIPKTKNEQGEIGMNGSKEITESNSTKSLPAEIVDNQPEYSRELSINLEGANRDSMNLLDSSAQRLHDSLKRMLPISNEETMRHPDIHTVQVAVHVAAQITNLMRLKLDVLKFGKTLKNG